MIIVGIALILYLSVRARTGVSGVVCLTFGEGRRTAGGRRLRCRGWCKETGRETLLEALVLPLKGDETEGVESIFVIGVVGAQDDLTSPFLDLFKLVLCSVNTHQLTLGCPQ